MQKIKLIFAIFLIFCIVNICDILVFAKANTDLDNPKEPKKSKVYEEPDMLIPPPETPKDIKKKEKAAKKKLKEAQKQAKKKKKKESDFKKSKHLKKRTFKSIKKEYNAPKTFDEYVIMSKEVKREDLKVPPYNMPKDEKIVNIPDPDIRIIKYNTPPGARDLDLRLLMKKRELVTEGVVAPDVSRMAYSVVYSYPPSEQVASEIFIINIPEKTPLKNALTDFHTIEAEKKPILKSGTENLFQYEKRTLVILDWSEDGKKLAVKEKIGAQTQGPWKTQLWTYDFEENKAYELTAIREAIRYYWKNFHDLDLIDYMWDIYPVGWDLYNKDRIVVYAYAFGQNHFGAKFLGAWSIDYKNQRTEMMSENASDFEVSINGYCLELKHQNR